MIRVANSMLFIVIFGLCDLVGVVAGISATTEVPQCLGLFDLSDIKAKLQNAHHNPLVVLDHVMVSASKDRNQHRHKHKNNTEFLARVGEQSILLPANLSGSPIDAASPFLFVTTEYTARATVNRMLEWRSEQQSTQGRHGSFVTTRENITAELVVLPETDPYPGQGSGFTLRFNHALLNNSRTWNSRTHCESILCKPELRRKKSSHHQFFDPEHLDDGSECGMIIPYIHGAMEPQSKGTAVAPWHLDLPRTVLLTFCGSTWRGRRLALNDKTPRDLKSRNRKTAVAAFHTFDDQRSRYGNMTMFSAPMEISTWNKDTKARGGVGTHKFEQPGWGNSSSFYRVPWEAYAQSVFCWQPGGDTRTRRAFYDSWMFGCIPVIGKSSSKFYRSLFGGILFPQGIRDIDGVAVVVSDKTMFDAQSLMKILDDIPPAEIACRRARLQQLAPFVQWGHGDGAAGHNALDMIVASFASAAES